MNVKNDLHTGEAGNTKSVQVVIEN